jgi:hypothetical protein
MKALATAFSLLLAASVAFAQSTSPAGTQTPSGTGSAGSSTTAEKDKPGMTGEKDKDKNKEKEFKAEVVSTDATARTITFKKSEPTATDSTASMTLTVDSKAENSLKDVKAGDQVKIHLKTDDTGKQLVRKIEKVDARPAGSTAPTP